MQTYRITIEPVSPGTMESDGGLKYGDGTYLLTPDGREAVVLPATQAQIQGIQGYLVLIQVGAPTNGIETAVTAAVPA